MLRKKATGAGKLVGKKNCYDRNSIKASKIQNSMSQRNNVSTIDQFQFSNLGRSSMEELEGSKNYYPVPEFKWFNNFASNNLMSKPCDQYLGFGPSNNMNSNYPQSFGNCPMDNMGEIPEASGHLGWGFPNNNTTSGMCQYDYYIISINKCSPLILLVYCFSGQCSQMQLVKGNSHVSLLMDDELGDIFKQVTLILTKDMVFVFVFVFLRFHVHILLMHFDSFKVKKLSRFDVQKFVWSLKLKTCRIESAQSMA